MLFLSDFLFLNDELTLDNRSADIARVDIWTLPLQQVLVQLRPTLISSRWRRTLSAAMTCAI